MLRMTLEKKDGRQKELVGKEILAVNLMKVGRRDWMTKNCHKV